MQEYLPFPEPDIPQDAPDSDVVSYMNPLLALGDTVRYVSPLFADRMESESRHADRRYEMLKVASTYYEQGQFSAAISELREIRHDLEVAGDETHFSDIDAAIEHCRQRISVKIINLPAIYHSDQIA